MYTIRSNTGEEFIVNKNVIDASTLLKNICELTAVTEPIKINCSSLYLKKFITIIDNYDCSMVKFKTDAEEFKEFGSNLEMLVEMVIDLAILDSDILLDFAADIILSKIKYLKCNELKDFFEFEDEFLDEERKIIEENIFDFFVSMDFEGMKFPFSVVPSFHPLANKFYTPMNVLLARIIQRSEAELAFELSIINKTLKNENDRYPLKPLSFSGSDSWSLRIRGSTRNSYFTISPELKNEKYFTQIKSRKIILSNRQGAEVYFNGRTSEKDVLRFSSLDFIIPHKDCILRFQFENANEDLIYLFDLKKCPLKFVNFYLSDVTIGFDKFYKEFIANDFSKKIAIYALPFFDIFTEEEGDMTKKPGATKFCEVTVSSWNCSKPNSKFKDFILNYMEEDGIIRANYRLFPQVEETERNEDEAAHGKFRYTVSQAMEAFEIMELREQLDSNSQQYPEDRSLSPVFSF